MVEKAAVFRTAHEALGLIDAGAEEASMSDGQLRARYQALKRDETWAPRHVDDDLAAAHQQAARSRTDAAVWATRLDNPEMDDAEIDLLRDAVDEATTKADAATEVARDLEVDQARAQWYAETAVMRDFAHRSGAELRARGIDPDAPDDRVTAVEWIEAHRAEQADTDRHREITEDYELDGDQAVEDSAASLADEQQAETDVPDIRDTSVADPAERAETRPT